MVSLCMLLFILGVVLLNVSTPDRAFSDSENRVLAQKPEFTFAGLFSGTYTEDYEKYLSDQFSMKDFWMGVKTGLEERIGKQEYNGVYLGGDGYLLQGYQHPDEESLQDKIKAYNSFQKLTPEVNKYFMLVPTATEVYKDHLPPYAPVDSQMELINRVTQALDEKIKVVDVSDTLLSHKNEELFYKTDHHWRTIGAYYAYRKFMKQTGEEPLAERDFMAESAAADFYGSLYSKSGIKNISPDSIHLYHPKQPKESRMEYTDAEGKVQTHHSLYFPENLKKKDKYTVFLNGNHPLVKISTDGVPKKKLLIIKDSYANTLIPFLTNHYSEIFVVDLRFYGDNLTELMQKNQLNEMLFLYNVNTFTEDASVQSLVDYIDMDFIEAEQERKKEEARLAAQKAALKESMTPRYNFKEYFAQDVFMGDSITEAVSHYEILNMPNVNAKMGININEAAREIPKIKVKNPRNIYLLYGVNDMDDRMPIDWFTGQYRTLVRMTKARYPNARIYVQSVLPVEPAVEKRTPHTNNAFINQCNAALEKMAAEEKVNYVNINQLVTFELEGIYEGDGKHFKRPFYNMWFNFMVEHTGGGE